MSGLPGSGIVVHYAPITSTDIRARAGTSVFGLPCRSYMWRDKRARDAYRRYNHKHPSAFEKRYWETYKDCPVLSAKLVTRDRRKVTCLLCLVVAPR